MLEVATPKMQIEAKFVQPIGGKILFKKVANLGFVHLGDY